MCVCVCVCVCVCGKLGRVEEEWEENGECKSVHVKCEMATCPDVCPNVCPKCPNCVCVRPSCDESEVWEWIGRMSSVWTLIGVFSVVSWVWKLYQNRRMIWQCMVLVWECVKKVWMFCCVRGLEEVEEEVEWEGDEWEV